MDRKAVSLKKFAEQNDITYITAHRHWMRGNIDGKQLPTGKILVYGWKVNDNEMQSEDAIIFIRYSKGKNASLLKDNLIEVANKNSIKVSKEILWQAYSFQNNPYLDELYNSSYKFIITTSLSDIFGINYPFFEKLFLEKGKEVIVVKEPSNIPNIIYKTLAASSNIAKAAVGMHSYKKDIAESNNALLD